ncbi:MAG: alpha-galactosidase [Lachnospiraceae bacterium]|nr:alpha-galactosidase [Lachnospiraceae bacterium]
MGKLVYETSLPDRVLIDRKEAKEDAGVYTVNSVSVSLVKSRGGMNIEIESPKAPVREVVLVWNKKIIGAGRTFFDAWERGYGEFFFSGAKEIKVMPWYFVRKTGNGCLLYGVKTGPASMCSWEIKAGDVLLHVDVRNGDCGVELGDRRLRAASVVMCESKAKGSKEVFDAVHEFLCGLCDSNIYDGKPVYGANNWYYAYGKSSRDEVLADAAYLAKMTEGLDNRPFMVIDDGWQQDHSDDYNGGPWRKCNRDYGDMAEIAEGMKELKVRPGIWLRPLCDKSKDIPKAWRLKRHTETLDISVPEVLSHIAEDIRIIRDWGYELIKYDFSTWDIFGRWGAHMGRCLTDGTGWSFKDRSRTTAELIKELYRVIYENAGGMMIIGCNCIGHLGAGFFQINRTGDDTSGREWERTRKYGVNTLAFRMPMHGAFFAADADCVGITESIDWQKNRQWMEILSLSGTPFFVSVRPGTLNKEQEAELKKAYRIASTNTEVAIPIDWDSTKTPETWMTVEGEKHYTW